MKTLLLSAGLVVASFGASLHAQDAKMQPRADKITSTAPVAKKSPMNSASMSTADGYARIVYSQPMLRGRDMFGDQVAYGKVWRLGANETTELFLTADAMIGGKLLPAGAYSMFAIPSEGTWTLVFNRALGDWGAYSYSEAEDVLRVDAPVKKTDESFEAFTVWFDAGNMIMAWGTTRVMVPIEFKAA